MLNLLSKYGNFRIFSPSKSGNFGTFFSQKSFVWVPLGLFWSSIGKKLPEKRFPSFHESYLQLGLITLVVLLIMQLVPASLPGSFLQVR
jgi:hypothetical protein